ARGHSRLHGFRNQHFLVENAVLAGANTHHPFFRFKMDVARPAIDGAGDDAEDELDDRSVVWLIAHLREHFFERTGPLLRFLLENLVDRLPDRITHTVIELLTIEDVPLRSRHDLDA